MRVVVAAHADILLAHLPGLFDGVHKSCRAVAVDDTIVVVWWQRPIVEGQLA